MHRIVLNIIFKASALCLGHDITYVSFLSVDNQFITNLLVSFHAKLGHTDKSFIHTRALVKFIPVHHWEQGELKSGQKRYFFGEMRITPFSHDIQAKQLIGHLRAMYLGTKVPLTIFGFVNIFWSYRVCEKAKGPKNGQLKGSLFMAF